MDEGKKEALIVIAGPCVLDAYEDALQCAVVCRDVCERLGFEYYFKASWDKANRTSISSYRGPGLTVGLDLLAQVKSEAGVSVLTDFHTPHQAARVAGVADVLQVPAFLCRQTDMIAAAARTGCIVNVKKGQFVSGADMGHVVAKFHESGGKRLWLTERGNFYGYGDLVVDFRNIRIMRGHGVPVIFDATHSVQKPGAGVGCSGADARFIGDLGRAAVAVGVDGLFFEVHPRPEDAKCDGPNSVRLEDFEKVLTYCLG